MTDTTAEEWRPIPGHEGRYDVSSKGQVRSLPRRGARGGIMTNRLNKKTGYPWVLLSGPGGHEYRQVHSLVALAFLGPCPEGQQVRHKDGDRMNPEASNLNYGTCRQNQLDSIAHGTHANAAKTHCPQGHEYTPENTYILPSRPTNRYCRACGRAHGAARYQRTKVRP